MKGFAQGVALKQRRKVTRKSPIDLDVLRAQRITGPLLNYPQITEVGKPDHVENKLVKVTHLKGKCINQREHKRLNMS